MDRLLSYQGPIVHVDHSGRHRQAAPTGAVVQGANTRSGVQRGRYFVHAPGWDPIGFDYTLSARDDAGNPMMSPKDVLAAWAALFEFAKTRHARILHRKEEEVNLVIDPTFDYKVDGDGKAGSVWLFGYVLQKDWKLEDGPVFVVQYLRDMP